MIYKKICDNLLISLYKGGNELAISELVKRYKCRVFSTIFLIVRDKYIAEDLFQETFIKAIDQIRSDKYNEEGKFLPWINRIGYNLAIDHFRKLKRQNNITSIEQNPDIFDKLFVKVDIDEDYTKIEEKESNLRRLINELPINQREVIILKHYSDMSFKEIAEMTKVSINTALGRMRYALQNLRKLINQNKIEI